MIQSTVKEQTAFRFDRDLLVSMKLRAKSLGRSLNSYITFLIMEDLKSSLSFPRVSLPDDMDTDVKRLAGIMDCPTDADLAKDERLAAIWNR